MICSNNKYYFLAYEIHASISRRSHYWIGYDFFFRPSNTHIPTAQVNQSIFNRRICRVVDDQKNKIKKDFCEKSAMNGAHEPLSTLNCPETHLWNETRAAPHRQPPDPCFVRADIFVEILAITYILHCGTCSRKKKKSVKIKKKKWCSTRVHAKTIEKRTVRVEYL